MKSERILELSSFELPMENDWENLTDPILLSVFSYLSFHELNNASKSCKNWYRVAQDESLWRELSFRYLGSCFPRHDDSWKSELKRLTYHAPVHLHQTCESHVDEVYNVCFSKSGKYIATCGLDGNVKVWLFGPNTELLHSRQVVDPPSYVNYVEFNEAETHLLLNCMIKGDTGDESLLAVMSIEKEFAVIAARQSWFPNFRGTWLKNDTFLNADVLAYFFSNDNIKLVACTFYEEDLDDPFLLERPLLDRLSDNNVDLKSFLEMERDEFRPHFVKVIDWSEWNRDSPTKRTEDSNDNEKVVILFQRSLEWDGVQRIVFYKADIDSEIPSVTDPIKTIFINYGCTGVQLSADHRYIVYNFRGMCEDGDKSWYDKEVDMMVINLAKSDDKPKIFSGNVSLEYSTFILYFFPAATSDFIASGSEQDAAVIWDRHSKCVISKLPHHLQDPATPNGVSAVAFHPLDQEILVSVADDCKLRIWMSANRTRHL